MSKPFTAILTRCDAGFFLWQKVLITALALAYAVSPLDLIPDVFLIVGWGDDVFVMYLLYRVWMSPTLPQPTSSSRSELAPMAAVTDIPPATRRRVANTHVPAEVRS